MWFAGEIGQDGLFLREHLTALKVHVDDLRVLDAPSGHAVIQVDDQGSNAIILYGGANQCLRAEDVEVALNRLTADDWLLMQNEINDGGEWLEKAAARGIHVALNPSPMSAELLTWPLHLVDLFILNEVEGEDLTGHQEPDAILDDMLRRYPGSRIVLTLGSKGAVYADAAVRCTQAAVPVQAVDTTAAGDTFIGYFLHGLLRGENPADGLRTAAVAAAITVTRPGAGEAIPYRKEVCAFHAQETAE